MSDQQVAVYEHPAASDLEQWARDLTTAYQAARQLVTTSFVPASYKGKPEEAAAAIITGQELGLSPLAALRSIDIINGTPAMRAVALRALVQNAGHEIWTDESTATQAIVKGRRKGSDKVEQSVWTMTRAQGLGLHTKDNWRKQPIAMLLARATSELVRLIAADVLLGIPYSVEEVIDQGEMQSEPVAEDAPRQRASRSVKRKPIESAPQPQPEEPPLDTDEADPATGKVTESVVEPVSAEPIPEQIGTLVGGQLQPTMPFEGNPLDYTQEEIDSWNELPPDDGGR
ncbi:hypothetical protein [Subtercola sp. YIM 133946]|uniref:hypothetical protein n=1 Tax=Subtercola sp. YIM 133946 TaxID=3118909 RepID=UPI002F95AC60